MRSEPHLLLLRSVRWDIFATLTWADRLPAHEDNALTQGIEFLEVVRQRLRMPAREWFWFLRAERGEAGGRLHLHAVIKARSSDLGWFCPGPGRLSAAHRLWKRGRTQFRRLDDGGGAVIPYIVKLDSSGADSYELGKTARAAYGVPSSALGRRALLQKSGGECLGSPTDRAGKHTGGRISPG